MQIELGPFVAPHRAIAAAIAVAALTSSAAAQTTYRLAVTSSNSGYLGTTHVVSSPEGIDCISESSAFVVSGGTCAANFPAGASVSLSASAVHGGTFDGWVGACEGQGATCQVTMTANLTTSPKAIAKTYTLTILGTGNSDGSIRGVDFITRPRINCQIGPGGVTSGTCVTEVPSNQWAWLGYDDGRPYARFLGFDPPCVGCMIFMDRPMTVTAGWGAMEIAIVPAPGFNGSGRVTGSVFDCTVTPTGASGACSFKWDWTVPPGSVTLTAASTGVSRFVGWGSGCGPGSSGNVCVITLNNRLTTLRPAFETPLYQVAVLAAGSGSGKVVSTPSGINCTISGGVRDQSCAGLFLKGTQLSLVADPFGGSTFGGWTGACSGSQPTCVLSINSEPTLATARFVPPRPASELAIALLTGTTLPDAEVRELDRFGNKDGAFNLGDLVALMSRTGERLSGATMASLLRARGNSSAQLGGGRKP